MRDSSQKLGNTTQPEGSLTGWRVSFPGDSELNFFQTVLLVTGQLQVFLEVILSCLPF